MINLLDILKKVSQHMLYEGKNKISRNDYIKLWTMGRDTTGEKFKEFEDLVLKLYGTRGIPHHIYDAMDKAKTAGEFLKIMKEFDAPIPKPIKLMYFLSNSNKSIKVQSFETWEAAINSAKYMSPRFETYENDNIEFLQIVHTTFKQMRIYKVTPYFLKNIAKPTMFKSVDPDISYNEWAKEAKLSMRQKNTVWWEYSKY